MNLARPYPTAFILLPCILAFSPGPTAQAPATKAQDAAKTSKTSKTSKTAPAELLTRWSPAIVTIRVVLKTSFAGGGSSQDSESNAELHGVVVDPNGLVMMSNAAFTAPDMFGAHEAGGFRMQITPRDFKVIFERDEKEYPAFLAATEKRLGLAFVQIQELGEKEITAVDFSTASDTAIGDPVVAVSRMGKGFDHAAYFRTTSVAGQIRKPRKAWILDRIPAEDGHPVFDSQGQVLGAMVKISSGIKSDESRGGFGVMISSLAGGSHGAPKSFLLPASVVGRIVKQAKDQAAKRLAERKEKRQK